MAINSISWIKAAFIGSSSPKLAMVGDYENVTPEASRALRSEKTDCEDITTIEPNWQGQYRLYKYL